MTNSITQPCDLDPIYINFVSNFLSQYGVTKFFYGITMKEKQSSSSPFKRLRSRKVKEMLNARYMVFSCIETIDFRHQYLSHFGSSDKAFFEPQSLGLNILKNADISTTKGLQLQRLRDTYNIKSWGTWRLPNKYNPNWDSVFVFYSDRSQEVLKLELNSNKEMIDHQLLLYATLFNDSCITQINPITNFNCVSTKCMQILQLTSAGLSSDEIGEQLTISESGVNYHQNRLKELFNAKNRAQLVSFAHSLGVLK